MTASMPIATMMSAASTSMSVKPRLAPAFIEDLRFHAVVCSTDHTPLFRGAFALQPQLEGTDVTARQRHHLRRVLVVLFLVVGLELRLQDDFAPVDPQSC